MRRQAQFVTTGKVKSLEYLKKESVELSLTHCGYEECDAGYRYKNRKKDCYMMYGISKGKCICTVNNVNYQMETNDLIFIPPESDYYFDSDPEEGCVGMWLGFTGMLAEECLMHSGFSENNLVQKTELVDEMSKLIENMLKVRERTFSNDLKRNGYLKIFFSRLIDEHSTKITEMHLHPIQETETSEYIRIAIKYIVENYSQKIKINELADYVGVNRSYLASSFKKATGYSPQEYLLSIRMERAKSLLETTDLPVNTISNSVGYSDQLAFSRMFKRYAGVSPTTYREEHKL